MSNPVERWLRLLIQVLPDGSSVTFDREALLEILEDAGAPREEITDASEEVEVDYTLEDVARLYDRAPNTIREWCHKRGLRHYKDATGRIRITRAALEAWQDGQRPPRGVARGGEDEGLGDWKKHYPGGMR